MLLRKRSAVVRTDRHDSGRRRLYVRFTFPTPPGSRHDMIVVIIIAAVIAIIVVVVVIVGIDGGWRGEA